MDCPKCGYAMSPFDVDCPRCKRMGPGANSSRPSAPSSPRPAQTHYPPVAPPEWQPSAPQQVQYPSPTPAAWQPAPPAWEYGNTSGTMGPVPPEVLAMGFSWGACGLHWVWGVGNKVYIALLVFAFAWVPYLGQAACLGFQIWLGVNGHRLAWQNRRFASFAQYQETMRIWNAWGVGLFIGAIVLGVVIAIVLAVAMSATGY